MKLRSGIITTGALILVSFGFMSKEKSIPKLGIVSRLEQDSLVYQSGFRVMGESVGRLLSPSLTEAEFQLNIERIKKAKCKIYLCNVFFPGTIKIAGPGVNENRVVGYADTVLSRAKQAGIPLIVLGSGGPRRIPDDYDKNKAKTNFIALCKKLASLAGKYGVKIALESLQSSETNFLNTVKEAAEIVRGVAHPNFRLNADIFHMMRENESPENIVEVADILAHCEIAEKQTRSMPGVQGDDFKPYLRALKKAKYEGYIFIEANSSNLAHDIPLSFKYLGRQLEEVYDE